jgi:Putative metallopeptidase
MMQRIADRSSQDNAGCAAASFSFTEKRKTGGVMKSIMRVAALPFALAWTTVLAWTTIMGQPALAQTSADLVNSQIGFSYLPPKSPKYLPMMERLKSFQLLEQLSQFLSPLRLPHQFLLVVKECGFVNAQFVIRPDADPAWRIELCYEFVEALERIGPKQGQQSEYTYEEVVVGSLVGVLLHEGGHAVFNMLDVPVFGREEDAADEMSTFIAMQFNKDVARTVIRGFAYMAKVWFALGAPLYSDEHGTGLQRYYNTLCLAYGGDPVLFKDIVDKSDLPKDRAANCPNEYQQIKAAFEKTVFPFVDQDLMKKVQGKQWLKLSAAQVAALRQQQQKQQQAFSFAACNLSSVSGVYMALTVRDVNDPQKWQVHGWFPIPDKGCNYIGNFYGDGFYWYAFGGDNSVWSASDTDRTTSKQCIDKVHAFDELAGATCQAGQVVVNFRRWDVDPASSGVTLKLN